MAAEGPRSVVAESIWMAVALLTFIYICKRKDESQVTVPSDGQIRVMK